MVHCIWILCFFLSVQFKENEKLKHIHSREKSVVRRAHHTIWGIVKRTRDFEEEESISRSSGSYLTVCLKYFKAFKVYKERLILFGCWEATSATSPASTAHTERSPTPPPTRTFRTRTRTSHISSKKLIWSSQIRWCRL